MKTGINLHLHTNDEIVDNIKYSFKEALVKSKELGITITALTCHDKFIDSEVHRKEAEELGMLFIPGIEKAIEGAHILVLNCDKEIENINTLKELKMYKESRPHIFIIAPHPYLPINSLKSKLVKYGDIFDAVEMTWFYGDIVNPNKKAERDAKILDLPFIATSDAHKKNNIDKGFAIIDIEEFTIASVFDSIRKRKFENINEPKNIFKMTWYLFTSLTNLR